MISLKKKSNAAYQVQNEWPSHTMAMFIRLIIRTFQLSVRTVFFSHNKSANSVLQPAYQHSRTGPMGDTKIMARDSK
jgi:hypothetical protein